MYTAGVSVSSQHRITVLRGAQPAPRGTRIHVYGALFFATVVVRALVRTLFMLPVVLGRHLVRVAEGEGQLWASVRESLPWTTNHPEARAYRWANLHIALLDVPTIALGILIGSRKPYGVLRMVKINHFTGARVELGVVSHQLVTTAGVNKIVDFLTNTDVTNPQNFKYGGFGTGATGPVIGNTALGTEFTTQYATSNTRPTGTQSVGSSANIYRLVATFSPSATVSPTEFGIFTQAATGGGTLLDRFTFTATPLTGATDSLQMQTDITFPAGG